MILELKEEGDIFFCFSQNAQLVMLFTELGNQEKDQVGPGWAVDITILVLVFLFIFFTTILRVRMIIPLFQKLNLKV